MHTYYTDAHEQHDPATLHQDGAPQQNTYYSEVAKRGTLLRDGLAAAGFPLHTPSDFGLDPIAEVHDEKLLLLLQSAYTRMVQEGGSLPVIPNTFGVGPLSQRQPLSIWGLLGRHCFDVGAPIFAGTWQAAYWSAQTALNAAAHVQKGNGRFAYALCRPPGHHAARSLYGGFCYLNNAAIAAHWLTQQGQRVALLDIDYHHGNGTQEIFYERSDVLVCSVHADPLLDYPYYWGYADEFGAGAGLNFNFNFPLPLHCEEAAYMTALQAALARVRHFVPDVLLLSLGVDTAIDDPVGSFRLTVPAFEQIGRVIGALALPTIVVQEGGYHLPTLADSVLAVLRGLSA